MSLRFYPGVGVVHLQTVRATRLIPSAERHRWDKKKLPWGETATCLYCGCQKHRLKTQPDWCERFQLAGTTEMLEARPACTGKPATLKAAQGHLEL
ncbi:MAG: hypothetical protein ACRYFK_14435 [Janthinobacterium lividum]